LSNGVSLSKHAACSFVAYSDFFYCFFFSVAVTGTLVDDDAGVTHALVGVAVDVTGAFVDVDVYVTSPFSIVC
jgi:hypothetical protein